MAGRSAAADADAGGANVKPDRRTATWYRHVIWRLGMVFLGGLVICSGALSAAMLWVIFGSPLEPRRSDPGAPAANGPVAEASIQPGQLSAGAAGRGEPGGETKAAPPVQPDPSTAGPAEPAKPADGAKPAAAIEPGPSSADPAKPAEEAKAEPPAGLTQPQPAQAAMQNPNSGVAPQANSGALTDQRAGPLCNVNLCTATYKSFNAADCTYQPYGGGPRSICELGAQSVDAGPQSARVATDPSAKATETQPAAAVQPTAPNPAGSQCNQNLCAATYRSFNAADCTYEPFGGGPRSICKLSKERADAPMQTLHPPADSTGSTPEANEMPVAGMTPEVAEPAMPDGAGPQCDRSRCAATYQSFHAADCTYQPEGGGSRRICEP